jgi:hypothetical protein
MSTYETIPAAGSDPELDALYAAITGRRAFRYSAAEDPLYRVAADRYIQNGRLAMRDTVGRAAALTGGYGSSYAQAAGQQQYDEYLRGLSEAIPQYYSLAFQQYQAQGQALQDAYDLARQRSQDAYGRQRDAAADARAAENAAYARQKDAYQQLYNLIVNAGYVPTDEELAAAGMTRAQAEALLGGRKQSGSAAGSGGSGGRGKSQNRKTQSKTGKPRSGSRGAGPYPRTTVSIM